LVSEIAPLLAQGKTVLSDRYFYSCLANLHARGYQNAQWITEISAQIPKPDLAFFCDVDVDTAVQRVRARAAERDRHIDLELQHALRAEYLEIAKLNGGVVIHTRMNATESFDKIRQTVDNIFGWEAT
jgi:dTMP kinase